MNSKELADAHWKYIEALLMIHENDQDFVDVIGFHYKSSFIHGYKHGIEAEQAQALKEKQLDNTRISGVQQDDSRISPRKSVGVSYDGPMLRSGGSSGETKEDNQRRKSATGTYVGCYPSSESGL